MPIRAHAVRSCGRAASVAAVAAHNEGDAMSTEENKAIIRRWIEVWNTGELGALAEIIAPNYVNHVSCSTIRTESPSDWYGQAVARHHASFPDLHLSIETLIAEGDTVVTRW